MKKILRIIGVIISIIFLFYLISIPYVRHKKAAKEDIFYTPTKYYKNKVFNQLDKKYLTFIGEDSVFFTANKFISSKKEDSITLNNTLIKRDFKKFAEDSNSEFYTITPYSYEKNGIFMLGNQFNIFNMLDDLTELSKRNGTKIYVIVYNGNGYSEGKADFSTQFQVNQRFYNFIKESEDITFIAGHSLGTVFATKLGVDNNIPKLALLAPASNIDDIAKYFRNLSPFWVRPYISFNAIKKSEIAKTGNSSENIKNYYGNLILSHGTDDTNLPFSMSEKIYKNCPSENKILLRIKNGDHYAPLVGENWEKIITFLK